MGFFCNDSVIIRQLNSVNREIDCFAKIKNKTKNWPINKIFQGLVGETVRRSFRLMSAHLHVWHQ